MAGSHLDVDGRRIALTNLERVLYPETGTRKFDVISYYLGVADVMLPHLASRPVTRKRWPGGVDSAPFFEKALPESAPDWLARFTIAHHSEEKSYPVARNAADLVWLAQMAALELHVPQWRIDLSDGEPDESARRTDRLVLDLDPGPGVPLTQCAQVALTIRDVLHDAGLTSYPVTSGGKGIHVYARFDAPVKSDSARTVAKQIATSLAQRYPDDVTAAMTKSVRAGKVFVDWSQNSAAKTTLSPYSLRGREQPWAAAPRTWSELGDPGLAQLLYSEVLERVSDTGDLLAGLDGDLPADDGVIHLGAYRRTRGSSSARSPGRVSPKSEAASAAVVPLRPMLAAAESVEGLDDDRWAFEGKWDGYRLLVSCRDGRVQLQSRSGIDMTADFPEIAEIGEYCDGHDVVLDGEVVALNDAGRTDFTLLTSRRRAGEPVALKLFLFDVLRLDDTDLEPAPWEQRRALLEEISEWFSSSSLLEVPPLLDGPGDAALRHARAEGWEGVVAKRRAAPYRQGRRSSDWRKQKNWNDVEVVIGGYRPGRGERSLAIGSLLVGLPEETGLRYVGRVGTGFTEAQLADLLDELRPLEITTCPFVGELDRPVAGTATWVLPKLVADVRFMDWTSTGHLRHPSWRGIRRDKLPGDL
ncbi:MAG: non-homologous end-joining DNA ligase [Gordonia sp. (in: high G+C Gram-positive bacteria)]